MIYQKSYYDSFQPGYVGRYDWVLANEVDFKTPQCFEKFFYYVHGLPATNPPELALSTKLVLFPAAYSVGKFVFVFVFNAL